MRSRYFPVEYIVESTDAAVVTSASSTVGGGGSSSSSFVVALVSQLSSAGVTATLDSISAPVVKAMVIVDIIVGLDPGFSKASTTAVEPRIP